MSFVLLNLRDHEGFRLDMDRVLADDLGWQMSVLKTPHTVLDRDQRVELTHMTLSTRKFPSGGRKLARTPKTRRELVGKLVNGYKGPIIAIARKVIE